MTAMPALESAAGRPRNDLRSGSSFLVFLYFDNLSNSFQAEYEIFFMGINILFFITTTNFQLPNPNMPHSVSKSAL